MKKVLILRHANWKRTEDALTEDGEKACREKRRSLPTFSIVISSPAQRCGQTAMLVSGQLGDTDDRAAISASTPELSARVGELLKTHPLGIAGARFSIPEAVEQLKREGARMEDLTAELLQRLHDGEYALIVSHDGPMLALEKVLKRESFDFIDHSYGELEGYFVDADLMISEF
jgi:broad specificity phosphatase PhoE